MKSNINKKTKQTILWQDASHKDNVRTFQHVSLVHVYFMKGYDKLLMGRLLLKDRKIFFEYDSNFIKLGLQLSPFKLPLKNGVIKSNDHTFEGLFGIFNDSIPDGWGRLLLDRKLISIGLNPNILSPLDRLCIVGSHGMGALTYEPELPQQHQFIDKDLDEIAEEVYHIQENEKNHFIDELLILGGSSAGARPKIMIKLNNEDCMVKFRSSTDLKDIGNIEYAYYLMGQDAGLKMSQSQLLPSKKGFGYFSTKRFDRNKGKRIHMHTISGLLHSDHRYPTLDYETIMKATLWLTRNANECEKQFRAAVFNVLSHNRDDHSKKFSYLMNEQGEWSISPSYDLTFSNGPRAEHCTTVMGEGKNPTLEHLIKLGEVSSLKKAKILEIIDEVRSSISQWSHFADTAGVSKTSKKMILRILEQNF